MARKERGQGTVQRYEGEEKMVVLLDEVGYKTLMAALVGEHGLLEPAGQNPPRRGSV